MRLSPFARRRAGTILLGIALTIASTAAAMVPTLPDDPLIDHVLEPWQKRIGRWRRSSLLDDLILHSRSWRRRGASLGTRLGQNLRASPRE